MRVGRAFACALLLAAIWSNPGNSQAGEAVANRTWTTAGFLGFSQGTLEDGGANTYVAADGTLRLINLWDLNNDGNIDLVFPSTHDNNEKVDLYIYWNKHGFSANQRTQLPTDGANSVNVADLDGDGYPDLIVVNDFNGTKTELNSYIYWGSKHGFDVTRRTELPTQGATAVAVADLNHDGYPDLVFSNSGVTYHVTEDHLNESYIYWGSKTGYTKEHRSILRTVYAQDVKILDLNHDGFPDIVFADAGNSGADSGALIYWGNAQADYSKTQPTLLPGEGSSAVALSDLNGDGYPEIVLANGYRLKGREMGMYNIFETVALNSYVYWGSPQGYSISKRTELPTVGASGVAVADLNHDGRSDIVFSNNSGGASYIYWADEKGYQPNRRTAIPTENASAVSVADLNHDGYPDLVFANISDGSSHNTNSYIYWGGEMGYSAARRTDLPSLGASGVVLGDLDRDGETDLVFANKIDGTDQAYSDSYIYWGDDKGQFAADRRQVLLTKGPNSYAAADINNDGYVDLFFPEVGRDTILWGSAKGYSMDRSTAVGSVNAFSGRFADFNRDGYLDLLLTDFVPGQDHVTLYYGGPNGFSEANRFIFRLDGVRYPAVADLDHDGWLDVIFPTINNGTVIYWGGPLGFDNSHKTLLPSAAASAVQVADLNHDGYLDLVVSNLFDKNSAPGKTRIFGGSAEGNTYIYWGSAQGYSASRRQVLTSVGNASASVADLNRDGYLDLVLSSYQAGDTRSHPSYIYWNSSLGFADQRVTMLPTNSAAGVVVADFNRDGYKDILFACHSKDGNHRTESYLYWGGPEGFSTSRRTLLPSNGTHLFNAVDIGNVYDRSDNYDYISAAISYGPAARFESISWTGETPFRTRLEFQVRVANTREELSSAAWQGPNGPESFYLTPGSKLVGLPAGASWIQYKARLVSPDSADTPVLRSVSIEHK